MFHRASSAYHHSKDRRRSHALMLQVFYSWKQQAMLGKSRERRLVRGLKWYTEVKLQRNVLKVSRECKPETGKWESRVGAGSSCDRLS